MSGGRFESTISVMPRFLIHHRHCWPVRRRACAAGDDDELPPTPMMRTTMTGLATITAA
jgi:hypothetical protein